MPGRKLPARFREAMFGFEHRWIKEAGLSSAVSDTAVSNRSYSSSVLEFLEPDFVAELDYGLTCSAQRFLNPGGDHQRMGGKVGIAGLDT